MANNKNEIKQKVADWLEKNFLEWQMNNGRQSLTAFAKYIGIGNKILNAYMLKRALPGGDKVIRLANLFGGEIYDILGWEHPKIAPPRYELLVAEKPAEYDARTEKDPAALVHLNREIEQTN